MTLIALYQLKFAMRYRVTESNITIEFADGELESIVAAAFHVLVPHIAPKLLFVQHEDVCHTQLRSLQTSDPRFRITQGNSDLRAIGKQVRIVEGYRGLTIAPNGSEKLDKSKWSAFSEQIIEQARQGATT